MNVTNNRPRACEAFAGPAFISPLVACICKGFGLLAGSGGGDGSQELESAEQRTEVMEGLILGLGAMINLAEFSDTARASVVHGGDELVEGLTRIFLEGSERAAKVRFIYFLLQRTPLCPPKNKKG